MASARPSATRWRCPPDRSVTLRSSSPDRLSMRSSVDARPHVRLADAAQPQAIADIAEHAHVRPQGIGLEHHGDAAPLRRHVHDVLAEQADGAGRCLLESRRWCAAGWSCRSPTSREWRRTRPRQPRDRCHAEPVDCRSRPAGYRLRWRSRLGCPRPPVPPAARCHVSSIAPSKHACRRGERGPQPCRFVRKRPSARTRNRQVASHAARFRVSVATRASVARARGPRCRTRWYR